MKKVMRAVIAILMVLTFSVSMATVANTTKLSAAETYGPGARPMCVRSYEQFEGNYSYCYEVIGTSYYGGYIPYIYFSNGKYYYRGQIEYYGELE